MRTSSISTNGFHRERSSASSKQGPTTPNWPSPEALCCKRSTSVDAVVAACFAEILEVGRDRIFDTELFGNSFEERHQLRPSQMLFDIERLGDAIVPGESMVTISHSVSALHRGSQPSAASASTGVWTKAQWEPLRTWPRAYAAKQKAGRFSPIARRSVSSTTWWMPRILAKCLSKALPNQYPFSASPRCIKRPLHRLFHGALSGPTPPEIALK